MASGKFKFTWWLLGPRLPEIYWARALSDLKNLLHN